MIDRPDRRKLLTAVRARLAERGWSDPGGAVRFFVEAVHQISAANGKRPSGAALSAIVPPKLVAVNATDADTIASALAAVVADTPGDDDIRPLVSVDEIDSFAAIRTVSAATVADIARPLVLPELTVKRFIASIIGEAYVPKDWGGEGNDLFTARVVLGGQRVDTAFLLKGAGTKGRLTIARLGANGDQMIRIANSPAQLLVVQHVGSIDEAVRTNLIDLVTARRSQGRQLIGSVWDGVDCARLFVAYGLIDGATGTITQAGTTILDTAEKGASR